MGVKTAPHRTQGLGSGFLNATRQGIEQNRRPRPMWTAQCAHCMDNSATRPSTVVAVRARDGVDAPPRPDQIPILERNDNVFTL